VQGETAGRRRYATLPAASVEEWRGSEPSVFGIGVRADAPEKARSTMAAQRVGMARTTTRLAAAAALSAALLGGWLWGASGRWDIERALRTAEVRSDVIEARAAVLGARVSMSDGDYQGTIQQLMNARRLMERACGRLGTPGTCDDLLSQLDLQGVGAEIDLARRLAATLDSGPGVAAGAQKAAWSTHPVENR
jgi:hypothetical protein